MAGGLTIAGAIAALGCGADDVVTARDTQGKGAIAAEETENELAIPAVWLRCFPNLEPGVALRVEEYFYGGRLVVDPDVEWVLPAAQHALHRPHVVDVEVATAKEQCRGLLLKLEDQESDNQADLEGRHNLRSSLHLGIGVWEPPNGAEPPAMDCDSPDEACRHLEPLRPIEGMSAEDSDGHIATFSERVLEEYVDIGHYASRGLLDLAEAERDKPVLRFFAVPVAGSALSIQCIDDALYEELKQEQPPADG